MKTTSMPSPRVPQDRGNARGLFLFIFSGLAQTVVGVACSGKTITDTASYVDAAACITIAGSLIVDPTFSGSKISLASLVSVGGFIRVKDNVKLVTVDLPLLATVGSYFSVTDNAQLTCLNSPELVTVDNNLVVVNNEQLISARFLMLVTVGKSFKVVNNDVLSCASFPLLSSVANFLGVETVSYKCTDLACLPDHSCPLLPSPPLPPLSTVSANRPFVLLGTGLCADSPFPAIL